MTLQSPHLVLQNEVGHRYLPLVGNNFWTIGRSKDNTFVLTDKWVSRTHTMIQQMNTGDFYLIDLGSRNGSFVNGRRVSIPVILKDEDHLLFGQTELEFRCPHLEIDIESATDIDNQEYTATLHIRRLISVIVMDIRDFTVLTRKLDERVLSEVIGTWFRKAGDIIRKNGSWVDKYIGDAIMAVWFHGAEEVDSAEMVPIFQALKDLHEVTEELSRTYPLPFPLKVGAGVNTGYAMVGNSGSSERPDFTALGDTVNAAFRLESSTKEIDMDIALGEKTYHYISELKNVRETFKKYEVHLKGYDRPTTTYAATFNRLKDFLRKKLLSEENKNLVT